MIFAKQLYLNEPESPKEGQQPLFPAKAGKAISNNRIQNLIRKYTKEAGIRRITPHVLRHSFATEMYSRGVPFSAIQAMLGHENKAETALYIHVTDQMKQQGLAQVSISGGTTWQ